MAIIQDSQNLSPTGKVLCLCAFAIGLGGLGLATRQLGHVQSVLDGLRKEASANQMLQSNPEEVASVFSPVPPQSEKERETRLSNINRAVKKIGEQYARITSTEVGYTDLEEIPVKETLGNAVGLGILHPTQASHLLEEFHLVDSGEDSPQENPQENPPTQPE